MTDFKTIPLKEIIPDPNQPRKYYDELAMQELTDSVKQKGVLQPILIRPFEKGYLLVCGERRYKAATAAELSDIPAVVRILSDEEALEMQIIENLQRKDVHPLEEAVAFKSLLENKTKAMTVEEVAAKVGKTIYFVRQRNKLNALTKAWQEVYFQHRISTTIALQLSALESKDQELLYKNNFRREGFIEINDYQFRMVRRQLKKAPFNIKDEMLNPKMGACVNCPFNSAVSSLFPDDAKDPICNNSECFKIKCKVAFDQKLKEVSEDPSIILIYQYNWDTTAEDKKLVEKLKKEHKVYEQGWSAGEAKVEHSPSKKDIDAGKYLKCFFIAGEHKGEIAYAVINKGSNSNSTKQSAAKIKDGSASVEDIDTEIARIKDREKRSKELDSEKIHKAILIAVSDNEAFKKTSLPLQPIDRTILIYLLLNETAASQYGSKPLNELVKVPQRPYYGESYHEDYFKKLESITDDQLALIIRKIVKDKWGNPETINGLNANHAPMLFISEYLKVDIDSIKSAQKEISDKRIERVNKRISQLQESKKEISKLKAVKPAASKPVTKKTAKKAAPKKSAKKK